MGSELGRHSGRRLLRLWRRWKGHGRPQPRQAPVHGERTLVWAKRPAERRRLRRLPESLREGDHDGVGVALSRYTTSNLSVRVHAGGNERDRCRSRLESVVRQRGSRRLQRVPGPAARRERNGSCRHAGRTVLRLELPVHGGRGRCRRQPLAARDDVRQHRRVLDLASASADDRHAGALDPGRARRLERCTDGVDPELERFLRQRRRGRVRRLSRRDEGRLPDVDERRA